MEKLVTTQKMRSSLQALLLSTAVGICALPALAGPMPTFSGSPIDATKVTVNVGIADGDVGKQGNIYIGASYKTIIDGALKDVVIFKVNPTSWVYWNGGTLPPYSVGPLNSQAIVVEVIGGLQLYAGYGLTEADMLNNFKYALVYTGPKQ